VLKAARTVAMTDADLLNVALKDSAARRLSPRAYNPGPGLWGGVSKQMIDVQPPTAQM
jgi:hypothetical protein